MPPPRPPRPDPRSRHPVTTVARTLVDLTDVLTAHQLADVIHEAAFRKRFDAVATREAMQRASGRRNLHLLRLLSDAGHRVLRFTEEDVERRGLTLLDAVV